MQSALVIRHYPDRQKPCLVLEEGAQGIVLATFRNEYCAKLLSEYWGGYGLIKEDSRTLDDLVLSVGKESEDET